MGWRESYESHLESDYWLARAASGVAKGNVARTAQVRCERCRFRGRDRSTFITARRRIAISAKNSTAWT